MTNRAMSACRHAGRIVDAVLDGTETSADRLHAATCATCTTEVQRARSFERNLALASAEVSDAVPDPASLPEAQSLRGWRASRLTLRLVTVGGAIIAGLLFAALIGPAIPPNPATGAFVPGTSAQAALELLDLPCHEGRGAVVCEAATADHAHRVELIAEDRVVIAVTATIANADGTTLPRSGGDALFRQIAAAVLSPEAASVADIWLRDTYPTCRSTCSVALDEVSLSMTADRTSVSLTLRSP